MKFSIENLKSDDSMSKQEGFPFQSSDSALPVPEMKFKCFKTKFPSKESGSLAFRSRESNAFNSNLYNQIINLYSNESKNASFMQSMSVIEDKLREKDRQIDTWKLVYHQIFHETFSKENFEQNLNHMSNLNFKEKLMINRGISLFQKKNDFEFFIKEIRLIEKKKQPLIDLKEICENYFDRKDVFLYFVLETGSLAQVQFNHAHYDLFWKSLETPSSVKETRQVGFLFRYL